MNVAIENHPAGFPVYTLTEGDEVVVVSAFGAQLLSWTKGGVPIVFENPERAVFDGKNAYRGGSPICFPYFGPGTLLPFGTTQNPQHGRARTSVWNSGVRDADSALVLTTKQPCATGFGPTDFSCELSFLVRDGVHIRVTVRNVGENESPFQLAVHTYWATEEPGKAAVRGLGARYLDNLLGLAEQKEDDSATPHTPPFDRIYIDAESAKTLITNQYRVEILTQGCSGAVIWNPGPNHNLQDLGKPDFICVESGQIIPAQVLKPGEARMINIKYRAETL